MSDFGSADRWEEVEKIEIDDAKRIDWLGENISLILVDNGSPLKDNGKSFRSCIDDAIHQQESDNRRTK